MRHYFPQTDEDLKEMLATIGVASIEELFATIPPALRLKAPLRLPPALSEPEAMERLKRLSYKNRGEDCYVCFMGGGAYDHFVPAVVDAILSRSEFYTAYTPYQAEVSQGTLQAIWEYQSMICRLTGMDAANASHYDGATALAEAMFVACAQAKKDKVLVSQGVHPHYREVLKTYAHSAKIEIVPVPLKDGVTNLDYVKKNIGAGAGCLIQSPNFLGCVENLAQFAEPVHQAKSLLVVSADPISLGLLEAPGKLGADIVTGEGQGFGNNLSFGGPYLGIFAVKKELIRRIPGRLIGQTTDLQGRRGFVMTLQTREQHIRREKATSNICTNQALCALAACITLELLGEGGVKKMAELCLQKAHYLADQIARIDGISLPYQQPFFKEFAVRYNGDVRKLVKTVSNKGFMIGPELGQFNPDWKEMFLVAVTEKRTKEEMDRLVETLKAVK